LCCSDHFFLIIRILTHIKRPFSVITHGPFTSAPERGWLLLLRSRGSNSWVLWCRRKIFSRVTDNRMSKATHCHLSTGIEGPHCWSQLDPQLSFSHGLSFYEKSILLPDLLLC
jgi:hypothetical protein